MHSRERLELERLFRQEGLGRLEDRLAVVEAFLATEEHLSSEELNRMLTEQGQGFSPELVTETLDLMCRFGFAYKKEFAGGRVVYEHRHLDDHHDHLICTHCGRIVDLTDPQMEQLQLALARRHGFKLLQHRHQLYGICPGCQATRQPAIPLTLARPGESLEVVGYLGGRRSQAHLADLGLTPGTEIEVLSADGGPLVLACRGSRLAIGHNLAMKLTCRPKDPDKPH